MIYVDPLEEYAGIPWRGGRKAPRSCHLWSDASEADLQAFARSIGLPLAWFQASPPASEPHYDLSPSWRAKAVKAGAREITHREASNLRRVARGLPRRPPPGTGDGTCSQPDRDMPGLRCGYPIPCPHHPPVVIDLTGDASK